MLAWVGMHPDSHFRNRPGFTLIEVMIVLAILGGILAIGGSQLFRSSTTMRTFVREMAIRTREIRNVARMTNSTMRIVISMNDEKGHSYWIESAPGTATMMSEEQLKELERMTSIEREEKAPKKQFDQDSRILRSPQKLPRGLFFGSVDYATRAEPVTSGTAYVHFFPQGLAEEVAILLTDKKNLNWTITVNPLTGRADVYERKVSLKELQKR